MFQLALIAGQCQADVAYGGVICSMGLVRGAIA